MAAQTGTRTSFNSTVGLRIDLSDVRPYVVTPDDTPLLDRLSKKNPSINAVLHQWQEDTLVASTDSLTAMYTTPGATLTVNDFTLYKKGMVLRIDDELFRVSATPSANPVSVQAAYQGTTGANHANSSVVLFVGYAVTDGADPEQFITTNRTISNNLIEVFQEAITVSDLEQWAQNYGIDDKYTYEVKKWLRTLNIRLEQAILFSVKGTDSTNSTRTMDGILSFITTNVTDAAAAVLTETMLNDTIENCFKQGGTPNLIVVNSKQKRKLTGLIAASQKWYRQGDLKSAAAGGNVEQYISDFGVFDVLLDRNMRGVDLLILQTDNIGVITGKPFTHELLAKTGTADKGEIVGWYTLEMKAQQHSGRIKNLG